MMKTNSLLMIAIIVAGIVATPVLADGWHSPPSSNTTMNGTKPAPSPLPMPSPNISKVKNMTKNWTTKMNASVLMSLDEYYTLTLSEKMTVQATLFADRLDYVIGMALLRSGRLDNATLMAIKEKIMAEQKEMEMLGKIDPLLDEELSVSHKAVKEGMMFTWEIMSQHKEEEHGFDHDHKAVEMRKDHEKIMPMPPIMREKSAQIGDYLMATESEKLETVMAVLQNTTGANETVMLETLAKLSAMVINTLAEYNITVPTEVQPLVEKAMSFNVTISVGGGDFKKMPPMIGIPILPILPPELPDVGHIFHKAIPFVPS